MARASSWETAANAFQQAYGITRGIQKTNRTKRIMDDEQFMMAAAGDKKAGAGFGLEGSELEKARYTALGNLETEFGNAEGGLANRQLVQQIEQGDRDNRVNDANEASRIRQEGALREMTMKLENLQTQATTGLTTSQTEGSKLDNHFAKLSMPIRVDSLGIARDADAEKLRFDRLNNPELVAQSRNATVGGVLKNRQDQVDLQYSLDTAVSKTDAGVAAFGASKAEDNVAQIVAENPYALFAKMSANKVEAKRNGTELKLEPLRYIEQSKELKKLAQQHQTETSAARRDEMKLSAMYQYQKGIQSGKYGTGENFNNEQATNDFLQLTAAFEGQPAAAALYNKYVKDGNETELAKVVQTGMVFGAKVKSALQKPDGVFKVVELFDVENGGAFGMRLDTQHPKGPRIVETNEDGSDFRVVAQGANMTALGANLQALTGPSAMIGLADQMALRKKEGLDNQTAEQSIEASAAAVNLSKANIKRINQEILSASGERKLNQAQTKLLTQKAQQIVSELQQEDTGLSFGAKQKEYYKATAKFLTTYLVNNPSGDGLDAAAANFKAQLMGGDFAGYEIVE